MSQGFQVGSGCDAELGFRLLGCIPDSDTRWLHESLFLTDRNARFSVAWGHHCSHSSLPMMDAETL